MFLHLGASLHGHEYSSPSQPAPRRSPLLRAALTHNYPTPPPTNILAASTTSSSAASSSPSPAAAAAASAALAASTTTVAPAASPANPIVRSVSVTNGLQARPAGAIRPRTHQRHASDGFSDPPRLPEPLVRFQEPVVANKPPTPPQRIVAASSAASRTSEHASDDESGFSGSEGSFMSGHATAASVVSSTTKRSRRRRPPRKSTTFLLAHPAPKLRTKKQLLQRIRPTLLVQLQQVSPNRRPMPVIDVYPSSLIAGDVVAPRFSKRFPRLFGVKGELGLHDTILVRSEDYDAHPQHSEGSDADDDASLDHRSLLAVLSPVRHDSSNQTEIVLEDGTVWKARQLPNGSFEFVHVDEHGFASTVRWVRRCSAKTRPLSASLSPASTGTNGSLEAPTAPAEKEPKFIFSIIDPRSRRHPILATLTRTTLDILDQYTTVSPPSDRYPPLESTIDEEDESGTDTTPSPPLTRERTIVQVDDALREFISITAIWVSLRSGLSDLNAGVAGACSPTNGVNKENASQKQASGSFRRRRSPPLTDRSQSPSPEAKPRAQRQSAPVPGELPRSPSVPKATSTGAAFVQRRKHLHQADMSDYERRSFSGIRRSKASFRFSGDFASASPLTRQSPSPTGSAPPPDASWVEVSSAEKARRHASMGAAPIAAARAMPVSPSASAVSTDVQRTQSAYYSRNPLSASVAQPRNIGAKDTRHGSDDIRSPKRGDSVADKGNRSRWRRMGNWFKKIGGR